MAKSYLAFQHIEPEKGRKTAKWLVWSGKLQLGHIAWHAPWRKYTFWPADGCLFDSKCLAEINHRLDSYTAMHKGTWRPNR